MEVKDCVLQLNHLVFDEISFKRTGFRNDNDLKIDVGFGFEERKDGEFVSRLRIAGEKDKEFKFVVCASGFFNLGEDVDSRDIIMRQNSLAIIFPYIRSQVSLITAQPEMEPIVLPPINVAQMVQDAMERKDD